MDLLKLAQFADVTVAVVGDLMLDQYWFGTSRRISPEAPVPVVSIERDEYRLGGACNVAANVSALRGKSICIGLCGDDQAHFTLKNLLEENNIIAELVAVPGPTTVKLRIISQQQQLIRLDFEQTQYPQIALDALHQRLIASLASSQAVILSDYGKGALQGIETLIKTATNQARPILIDPKGTDFARYRGATVITPNESEFEAVVGKWSNQAEFERKAHQLRSELELNALLVTQGAQGASLFMPEQQTHHFPTKAQEVFDVTGAGDTVIATLGTGLAAGWTLPDAVALANYAAGVVVGKLGTAQITLPELRQALPAKNGGLTEDDLLERLAIARNAGETIVMTNGCFDILHAGHVQYLQAAKQLGHRLVVAINSDASVRRLKGASRPLNPLDDRIAVLSALASVDYVIAFDDDTPQELIARILPDVLVKGGDYTVEQIAGHQEVIANGGEVKILELLNGRSTSALVERVQRFNESTVKSSL